MIEAFTHRAPDDFGPNRHTKLIVRPSLVRQVHISHYFEMDGAIVSPSGTIQAWDTFGLTSNIPDMAICRINHYFTRSKKQWDRKILRGYKDIVRHEKDFDEYDRNEIFDDVITRYASDVKAAVARSRLVPAGFADIDIGRSKTEGFAKGSPEWAALQPTMRPVFHEPLQDELVVDPDWYCRTNPDVAAAGLDALIHFWTSGVHERRDPNPHFDTSWYVRTYPDVLQYAKPPFLHFIELGAREGRRPNGHFLSPARYF